MSARSKGVRSSRRATTAHEQGACRRCFSFLCLGGPIRWFDGSMFVSWSSPKRRILALVHPICSSLFFLQINCIFVRLFPRISRALLVGRQMSSFCVTFSRSEDTPGGEGRRRGRARKEPAAKLPTRIDAKDVRSLCNTTLVPDTKQAKEPRRMLFLRQQRAVVWCTNKVFGAGV